MTMRRWAFASAAVIAVPVAFAARRPLAIAFEGSGMDPSIPIELRVAPSIEPELAEHTRIFDKKVYKVGTNVYCAVGWGLANIIMVEGNDGVLVVDTGESLSQARDVLVEFRKITTKPVAGIVLTHHHADHVLGTSAFVSPADVSSGAVPIFAHDSLVKRYVDENGTVAELQTVRSMHMYGSALGPADRRNSSAGIGPFLGRGESGFISPNKTFSDRFEAAVAGIRMEMRYVPSEADSEISVYLPDQKILLSAEVIQDHTFPNLYSIRGARYRDPLAWVRSIDVLRAWDADAMVLQHGPPVLGREEVARVLTIYRDEIQFVHDQTVRWMNHGLPPEELAQRIRLPPRMAAETPWGREYYGTVKQAVRNIYGGMEGWFQGDPVTLDPTPPVEYGRRLVALMGGRERVLVEARRALAAGDNQFAAELATHLVRIDTNDSDGRHVKASALRRLGYAQLNATWRNYYLVSAMELDDQIPEVIYIHEASKLLGSAMMGLPPEEQMAMLPTRLKAEETLDRDIEARVRYSDTNTIFTLHLRRGILEISRGEPRSPAFAIEVTAKSMGAVLAGGEAVDQIADGGLKIVSGYPADVERFFGWLEKPFVSKPAVVVR